LWLAVGFIAAFADNGLSLVALYQVNSVQVLACEGKVMGFID